MKKIFKAMEMIATSRIKGSATLLRQLALPRDALTRGGDFATEGYSAPLIYKPHEFGTYEHRRSAILVVTSDRGLLARTLRHPASYRISD